MGLPCKKSTQSQRFSLPKIKLKQSLNEGLQVTNPGTRQFKKQRGVGRSMTNTQTQVLENTVRPHVPQLRANLNPQDLSGSALNFLCHCRTEIRVRLHCYDCQENKTKYQVGFSTVLYFSEMKGLAGCRTFSAKTRTMLGKWGQLFTLNQDSYCSVLWSWGNKT